MKKKFKENCAQGMSYTPHRASGFVAVLAAIVLGTFIWAFASTGNSWKKVDNKTAKVENQFANADR